ncbi:melatonin receptor type 1C-like [Stylophora pistillata]|uniref:melatonin receptor type 1C-like n=1 Tax=Stylophora pistillata TaxID=50429 RepID=UPI000C04D105|nr:melatonin receptor type 1C-like [Stylophora pistillata]XP_022804299.1 melatonin receptor type 1C-like [Stylophora pistillata]
MTDRSMLLVCVESFMFLIINIAAIIGNAFVIAAILRNRGLRKITHCYILSLAISDLFVTITCIPLTLGASMKGLWLYGDVTCQLQGHVIQVWASFSLTIVSVTAINRYFRVVRPIRYRKIFTKRFTLVTTISSLVICACLEIGMMYVMDARFKFGPHLFCTPNFTNKLMKRAVALPIFISFIAVALFVVLLCYFKVYRVVRRHVILVRPNLVDASFQPGNENKLSCRVDEINATKMVFVIIMVNFLLWIPVCIIGALHVCDIVMPKWTHLMYDFLIFITTATNPLIYGMMNKAFRDEYLRILNCKKSANNIS